MGLDHVLFLLCLHVLIVLILVQVPFEGETGFFGVVGH